MENESIAIEVAFALPDEQVILSLKVAPGTTVKQGIAQSGILERFPQIDPDTQSVGIFSKACKPDQAVKNGDRIEIYRPLIADPKDVRRQRQDKSQKRKQGPAG
ncbi:MAG: hypothetical protein RIQ52_1253 [Pseudomonadota bacterium]|jgi:putative ubiquitin-RnfH superfamily antitoxin RatB of RatAB toxin-antitoxin module